MKYDELMRCIKESNLNDWLIYEQKVLIFKENLSISMELNESYDREYFHNKNGNFVKCFGDEKAYVFSVIIKYNNMPIKYEAFVGVDGGKIWIPQPDNEYDITYQAYKIGLIANLVGHSEDYNENEYKMSINNAKITVDGQIMK